MGAVESDFALAMSLFYGFDQLQLHGMRSLYHYLKTNFTSSGANRGRLEVIRSPIFSRIMKELGEKLDKGTHRNGPPGRPLFPITGNEVPLVEDSDITDSGFFYSHPKLHKLEEVVLDHFREAQSYGATATSSCSSSAATTSGSSNTRVMIFSQYRESVQEITDMLRQHHPLIKVMPFVGHSAGKSSSKGLTHKEQTEVKYGPT